MTTVTVRASPTMTAEPARTPTPRNVALEALRASFPPEKIGKLPKPTIGNEEWKKLPKAHCIVCGGWHASEKTIHLDFVGHADITERLLEVDLNWNWEPMGLAPDGLPAMITTATGQPIGLWIRLTVCGITRIGFGSVTPGAFDAEKQLIGDALRNAAMRFGVALDLWRKEAPPSTDSGEIPARQRPRRSPQTAPAAVESPAAAQEFLPHEGEPCALCADLGWMTASGQQPVFKRAKDGKLLFCNGKLENGDDFAAHEPAGQDIPF